MSQSRGPRTPRPRLNAEMHVCAHALGEHVYMYVCVDIDTAYTCTCIHAYSSCGDGRAALPLSSAGGSVAQSHSRQLALQPKGFAFSSLIVAVETPCLCSRKVPHVCFWVYSVQIDRKKERKIDIDR